MKCAVTVRCRLACRRPFFLFFSRRAPLVHSQAVPDAIVVKRAASPQNNSALMRLFLVVTADAALAICQDPESGFTTATHSVARRSAQKEQLYMAQTVLSRLLESGSL